MGASSSTIAASVVDAFGKHAPPGDKRLSLHELLRLPLMWGVDASHIGVLFALDR